MHPLGASNLAAFHLGRGCRARQTACTDGQFSRSGNRACGTRGYRRRALYNLASELSPGAW